MKPVGRVLAEVLFVLVAPVIAVAVFDICLFYQDGYLDPWIYTGLGQNFPLLHSLYGWNYYMVRFPVVFLNSTFPGSMDAVTGYVALRYLLLLLCGCSLYLWARAYFGTLIAGIAYLFLVCNPLLPRAMVWDLTTFVAIPSALAGICIWLLPVRHVAVTRFVAGFLFCVAIASQALSGTAILAFLLSETFSRFRKREIHALIVQDVIPSAGGGLVCLGLGILYYYLEIGPFDPAVILTMTLTGIEAAYFEGNSSQSLEWLAKDYTVYVSYFLVIMGTFVLGRSMFTESMEARVVRFGLLFVSAYALYQFRWHGLLERFYYLSYLAIVVYLLFPLCLALIMSKLELPQKRCLALVALGSLIFVPLVHRVFPHMLYSIGAGTGDRRTAVVLIGIAFACGVALIRLPRRIGFRVVTATVLLVGFIQAASFADRQHRMVFANPSEDRQVSVYRAAIQMMETFSAFSRPDAQVLLWYPFNTSMNSRARASMQSLAFAMGASQEGIHQLQARDQGPGLPALEDYEKSKLRNPNVRYIMMLSQEPAELDEARQVLNRNGYVPREVLHRTIGGEAYQLHLLLDEITSPGRPSDELLARSGPVPLHRIMPTSAASVWESGDSVFARSLRTSWAYIGTLDLNSNCIASGGWVTMDLRVKSGSIGVGIVNRVGDAFLTRSFARPSNRPQTIYLPVDSFRETGSLIVQNGDAGVSEFEILGVKLVYGRPEAMEWCDGNGIDPLRARWSPVSRR